MRLSAKLAALREDNGEARRSAPSTQPPDLYQGPYLPAAPDMLGRLLHKRDMRCVLGIARSGVKVAKDILEDNTKAWSGDHCVDPVLVPGSTVRQSPGEKRRSRH